MQCGAIQKTGQAEILTTFSFMRDIYSVHKDGQIMINVGWCSGTLLLKHRRLPGYISFYKVIVFIDFIKSDDIKYLELQGRNLCSTMCGIQQTQKRRVLIETMKKFQKPKNTKETSSG